MSNGDWFGLAAIVVSVIALAGGFLASPHFSSYARVKKLTEENKQLREAQKEGREEQKQLRDRVNSLMLDCEFWRKKFLDSQGPNYSRLKQEPGGSHDD